MRCGNFEWLGVFFGKMRPKCRRFETRQRKFLVSIVCSRCSRRDFVALREPLGQMSRLELRRAFALRNPPQGSGLKFEKFAQYCKATRWP